MATIVKRKVKKTAYYLLAGIVAIFVVCILGYNYYNDYKYQQTYEYKLPKDIPKKSPTSYKKNFQKNGS